MLGLAGDGHNYAAFQNVACIEPTQKPHSWSVRLYLGTLWLFAVSLGWLSISCSKTLKIPTVCFLTEAIPLIAQGILTGVKASEKGGSSQQGLQM